MNRTQLIEKVAQIEGVNKALVDRILRHSFTAIQEAVAQGEGAKLPGFGAFGKSTRKAREGRNPKTGEKLTIPQRHVPRFTPSKQFKAVVNATKSRKPRAKR